MDIFTPTQSFVVIYVAAVGPPVHVYPTALVAMTASAAAPVSAAYCSNMGGLKGWVDEWKNDDKNN